MMKLYVWDGVLRDYTRGIMFAVAESVEQAREVLRGAEGFFCNCYDDDVCSDCSDLALEPKVYDLTEPVIRAVRGGG